MSAPAQEAASASNGGATQAPARTRTFSWHDPPATAAEGLKLSGLDYIRAIASGELPPPPIADLLGFQIVEAEEGRAVFAIEPAEWMYNPIGMVHGGVAATLLDSCMGCAVHTSLAPGVGYTTTDLQVRYIRAMGESTGRVLAEGRLVHGGKRTATADGRVFTEADEELIAHGSTGCVIFA
ncbi:MAG TPA: PaaI family thioesterase [Solirubrobacteraceae bacterium]|nr:PaaI family thioesterase [Solirubrobacteraceae bacterium]